MRDFIVWVDNKPSPPPHVGFFINPKFERVIIHAASDYKMSRFKKRKHKMRKLRGKKNENRKRSGR